MVRGNLLHHIDCGGYGGNAIYADQGTAFLAVEENWMLGAPAHTFGGNNAECLRVRGNLILARAGQAQAIKQNMADCRRSYAVEDNIILTDGPDIAGPCSAGKTVRTTIRWRGNLYGHLRGAACRSDGKPLDEWMQLVQDQDSAEVDPAVVSVSEDGLRLNPGSALTERIARLPTLAEVGPRSGRAGPLPESLDAWPWPVTIPTPALPVPLLLSGETQEGDPEVMRDAQRWMLDPDRPADVTLRVVNAGLVPCRGRMRLRVTPPARGRIANPDVLDYDLEPGRQAAIRTTVTVNAGNGDVWLEAVSEAGAAPEVARLLGTKEPDGSAPTR